MRARLLKKFALVLNGIDLTRWEVGQVFDCDPSVARMLALEGWAELLDGPHPTENLILGNELPGARFWALIDTLREGKKDKLSTPRNGAR